MERPRIQEKKVETALIQFVFPFSIRKGCSEALKERLKKDGYEYFHLERTEMENRYYGEGYKVSHRNMERYYLPFTASVLFPHSEEQEGFQRYSRCLGTDGVLSLAHSDIGFRIHSIDIALCPFDLGFITYRTEITDADITFSAALEFANKLRQLENILHDPHYPNLYANSRKYPEVQAYLLKELASSLLPYLDRKNEKEAYFETLPFFVDEKMHVQALFSFRKGTELNEVDVYRAGQLDGVDEDGTPFISAYNTRYIEAYSKTNGYDRWAPETYYITAESTFICLTSEDERRAVQLANQMYGPYYYSLLLNLFHKIALLKLSSEYASVRIERDEEKVEDLIRSITTFSSKFFFVELVAQTQGRELFIQLRKVFGNDELYEDVKQTLSSLYRYQERASARNNNYLLLIFTVYTVITGIYGMNQVIEDLKGNIQWEKIKNYSIFEYLALFVTISGLVIGIYIGITALAKWMKEHRKYKERK
ncbi:hypothetical protein [Aneurinibacillus tyrosinisolvens]|uniref:hypothetical protein n=1 Tax=Aneurinibacillus tyrosinisolvens TaxID=1443435 RepID=UPI00063F2FE3|nr:hypothetical protein [Aneurinibacillus tyrosinisolvens]